MNESTLYIAANLDLDADTFDRLVQYLERDRLSDRVVHKLDELDSITSDLRQTPVEVFAFFDRRSDPSFRSVSSALAGIARADKVLEMTQLKQSIMSITLIDCSDLPAAPLSDFSVLSQYLEAFSDDLVSETEGRVVAMDYDLESSKSSGSIKWWDTRSEEFVAHFSSYMQQSLNSINTNFGQGTLPDFDKKI